VKGGVKRVRRVEGMKEVMMEKFEVMKFGAMLVLGVLREV
jgi:hypothetical protein